MQKKRVLFITVAGLIFILQFLFYCSYHKTAAISKIREAVDEIWIIDTHEHFWINTQRHADFFSLCSGYLQADMISSGMSDDESAFIMKGKIPVEERWKVFYPFWKNVKNTGYGQCVRFAVKGLFDMDKIDENTFMEINGKMLDSNKNEDWIRHVLKDKSRIDVSIVDPTSHVKVDSVNYPTDFCVRVERFDNFVTGSEDQIVAIEKQYGKKVKSLSGYLAVLDSAFENAVKNEGIVGIKMALAYRRKLCFQDVSEEEAESLFSRVHKFSQVLNVDECKKLEDFMLHQIIKRAEKYDLPIQIHTGMLARNFNSNPIENTNAIHLSNLFLKYRKVKFVLFHGSYPYMAELSYLAKSYPNVYIDMCWMYLISPSASGRYLEEWLLTVPSNKIMAFGGDTSVLERSYGHSVMARKIITETLEKMVFEGYFSENEAIEIARKILRENALEIYKLKKKDNHWGRVV